MIHEFNTLGTFEYSSILDVGTTGTACARVSVLLILPVLAVSGRSVRLTIPVVAVFWPSVLQYSQFSECGMYARYSQVYSRFVAHCRLCNTLPNVVFL